VCVRASHGGRRRRAAALLGVLVAFAAGAASAGAYEGPGREGGVVGVPGMPAPTQVAGAADEQDPAGPGADDEPAASADDEPAASADDAPAASADDAPAASADDARPPKPWDAPLPSVEALVADPEAHAALLAEQGIVLDLEGGTLAVRGGTIHDASTLEYPIEFLAVNDWGKAHEALFLVDAWPRTVDLCLRALGAASGGTLRYEELPPDVEPEPDWVVFGARDPEDARRWRAIPPHGSRVDVTVHWVDDKGKPHAEPLETLVLDLETGAALEPIGWVFVGGETLPADEERGDPERFLPDMHGNVIGLVLRAASEAVLERPSLDGIEPYRYVPNTERAPARRTPVTLVIEPRGS